MNTIKKKTFRLRKSKSKESIALVSTHGYVGATPPLGNPDTGGQVVYVLELGKKLTHLGYKVDILTRQFEDQVAIEDVEHDIRVIRFPCGGKEFIPKEYLYRHLPEWEKNAKRFIKANNLKYEFINSHYWDAGLAGQSLADHLKVKHIHTPHSLGTWKKVKILEDFVGTNDDLEKKYNLKERIKYETILYRECDSIIATSPDQFDIITKDYGIEEKKLKIIPPGYDDTRFYPTSEHSRQDLRAQVDYSGKKVIAAIGRLAFNKGFDLLVEAFSVVLEREPTAHLVLAIGSEEGKEDKLLNDIQKKIEENSLQNNVTLMGSLNDEDMANFYRAADVFVLSSRYEPIGMTAIEAMACGTPSVLTVHGGLSKLLEYGLEALFANPLDKYDLGITLLKALTYNRLRKRLSRYGEHKARALFTWTGIAHRVVNVFDELSEDMKVTKKLEAAKLKAQKEASNRQ
jgi:mannosylfructose-phosphate synthase